MIGFGFLWWTTSQTILSAATRKAGAIQVIQLYSEARFYGVIGLGVLLGAYIITRIVP
jgi:hypothetical protein